MTSVVRLSARPLAGALAADVDGVDLGSPLDDETVGELRALLDRVVVGAFRAGD